MNLNEGVDAAWPGSQIPIGTKVLAAYVGIPGQGNQSPDTPHIWTEADWNDYHESNPEVVFLPIYVHNYDDGQPEADGMNGVTAIRELGWAPNMPGDRRRILMVDCETLIDYEYFMAMGKTIYNAGFSPMLYGSLTVLQNSVYGGRGYWVASLQRNKPTTLPKGWGGQQWSWTGAWDWSVWSDDVVAGCGEGFRK